MGSDVHPLKSRPIEPIPAMIVAEAGLEEISSPATGDLDGEPGEKIPARSVPLGATTWWRRARFRLKRPAWIIVVGGTRRLKRLIDIVGSVVLLFLFSPILLAIAILVKLDSTGPVFFKQTRVGKRGRLFEIYKLRSMYHDAEHKIGELLASNDVEGGVIFKMKGDPRITRVGRLIRRFSIDELPQLWNVLKGEMSLVGPRPPLASEVAMYGSADRRRLEITPGITCIWQVSGRSEVPFHKQVELDMAYIESQSIWLDVKLLLKTVPAVLLARGAY